MEVESNHMKVNDIAKNKWNIYNLHLGKKNHKIEQISCRLEKYLQGRKTSLYFSFAWFENYDP